MSPSTLVMKVHWSTWAVSMLLSTSTKQDVSLDISVSWESSIGVDINKYIKFYNLNVETLPSESTLSRSIGRDFFFNQYCPVRHE